jgi:hypothetical protein
MRRRVVGFIASATLVVPLIGGAGMSSADTPADHVNSDWPAAVGVMPQWDSTAQSFRIFGADRYQTNNATELTQRSDGGFGQDATEAELYPFGSSDRTPAYDSATSLSTDDHWWGTRGHPHAIIVTVGDKFPDSLTASSLSDPGFDRGAGNFVKAKNLQTGVVDPILTEDAPIVITHAAREGATGLSPTASREARDVFTFETTAGRHYPPSAMSAIIVGGPSAVPTGVEAELQTIGFKTYRIGGVDRYDTARLVSFATGTGGTTGNGANCNDTNAADGANAKFVDVATLEYRKDASTCKQLSQTVVLADGITGADALSSGWFTSFYATPILLTGPGGSLPTSTQSALQTLSISNILVVGGTSRIPAATVAAAETLAGRPAGSAIRIAGADRYDTSVQLAQSIGGWFPQPGVSQPFANDVFCLASSSGEGDQSLGWPDALGAGPWCGDLNDQADGQGSPARWLAPANGKGPNTGGFDGQNHSHVPILLTATGSSSLSSTVSTFLGNVFVSSPADLPWCTGNVLKTTDCNDPGFAVAFGGTAVIPDSAFRQAATLSSGGTYTNFSDLSPSIASYWTRLNMNPVFGQGGFNDNPFGTDTVSNRVCFARDAVKDVHFLSVYDDAGRTIFDSEYDIIRGNGSADNPQSAYLRDQDGNVRSAGKSAPVCVNFDNGEAPAAAKGVSSVSGMSISGHFTAPEMFNYTAPKVLDAMAPQSGGPPSSWSGFDATQDDNPASAGMAFTETFNPAPGGTVVIKGTTCSIAGTGEVVSATVTRGASTTGAKDIDTFTASFTIPTSCGNLTGTASGEAILQSLSGGSRCLGGGAAPQWQLRGQSTLTGATFAGTGGFTANVDTNNSGLFSDDAICNVAVDGLSA